MQGTGLLATVVRHSLSAQAWRTATHQQELVCRSGRSAAATPGQRPDPLCAKNAGGRLPTGAGSRVARAAPTAPWASPERATALRGERTTCNQPNNNDWFKDILEHKLGKFQVYDCTQVRSRTWRKDMYMRSAVLLCPQANSRVVSASRWDMYSSASKYVPYVRHVSHALARRWGYNWQASTCNFLHKALGSPSTPALHP